MTARSWIGTTGGLWNAAFQWNPGGAPTSADSVTVTGPATYLGLTVAYETFQTISGPGTASSMLFIGNTALEGVFSTGAVNGGAMTPLSQQPRGLRLDPGTTLTATSLGTTLATVRVSGGAALSVAGVITVRENYPQT